MNRDAIHRHIDDTIDQHVEHVRTWVRQKSVSWDNLGVAECAEVVAQSYSELGCADVKIIDGRFHPGVWAYYDAGSPVTIHSYCMFDTRTVDPKGWTHDPWGAEIVARDPSPVCSLGVARWARRGRMSRF